MEDNFNPYKLFLECMLDSYKKDFIAVGYSLVFSVEDNLRINATITDSEEKRAYAGISAPATEKLGIVTDFLNRKLAKITNNYLA